MATLTCRCSVALPLQRRRCAVRSSPVVWDAMHACVLACQDGRGCVFSVWPILRAAVTCCLVRQAPRTLAQLPLVRIQSLTRRRRCSAGAGAGAGAVPAA
jgi:hypothetical protein